jgi:hypothetical protein
MRVVETARHPALPEILVYAVSQTGVIRRCAWGTAPPRVGRE